MNDTPGLILLARAAGAFGVRGEIRLTAYGDDPTALLAYGRLRDSRGEVVLTLTGGRPVKGGLVATAKEVPTREAAEALRGLALYIRREEMPPPEDDEYYLADLIGLEARDPAGTLIGEVRAVQNFGAGDILEIAPVDGGPTWYAPFTREVVPEVRLEARSMVIDRPNEIEADSH